MLTTGREFEVTVCRICAESADGSADLSPPVSTPLRLKLRWPWGAGGRPANLCVSGSVIRLEMGQFGSQFTVQFSDKPRLEGAPGSDCAQTPAILTPLGINLEAFEYYERLKRLRQHVLNRLSYPILLKEAARVTNMEATYFSDFFRRKTGVPFTQWLQHLRISKAISLIQARNLSITDLAYEVGFANLRSFERSFKKMTGLTPAQFKRSARPV